jgi:hypothetical protein
LPIFFKEILGVLKVSGMLVVLEGVFTEAGGIADAAMLGFDGVGVALRLPLTSIV